MPIGCSSWRSARRLSLFMAAVMFFSPLATLKAQSPPAGAAAKGQAFETRYITSGAALVAYLQPQQILTSPKLETMPTELASTAGLEFLGIDTAKIERIAVVIEPPMNGPPQFALVLSLSEALDINDLPEDLRQHTTKGKLGDREYFKSGNLMLPSFFMPDDTTLYIATQGMLQKQIAPDKAVPSGALVERIKASTGTEDLVVVADVQKLMPFIEMGMAQAAQQVPPQFQDFLGAPQHVQLVDLTLNVTQPGQSHLMLHATSAEGADKLEGLVNKAIAMGQDQMKGRSQMMAASEDPIEAAMGR